MRYPNAFIICTLSPMLSGASRTSADGYISSAVMARTTAGDSRVSYFAFSEQSSSNGLGCDYHPSAKTHQLMAAALVPVIRMLTGW
jgi:hypothetical protein